MLYLQQVVKRSVGPLLCTGTAFPSAFVFFSVAAERRWESRRSGACVGLWIHGQRPPSLRGKERSGVDDGTAGGKKKRNVHILHGDSSFHKGATCLETLSAHLIINSSGTDVTYLTAKKKNCIPIKKINLSLHRPAAAKPVWNAEFPESRPFRLNNASPLEP